MMETGDISDFSNFFGVDTVEGPQQGLTGDLKLDGPFSDFGGSAAVEGDGAAAGFNFTECWNTIGETDVAPPLFAVPAEGADNNPQGGGCISTAFDFLGDSGSALFGSTGLGSSENAPGGGFASSNTPPSDSWSGFGEFSVPGLKEGAKPHPSAAFAAAPQCRAARLPIGTTMPPPSPRISSHLLGSHPSSCAPLDHNQPEAPSSERLPSVPQQHSSQVNAALPPSPRASLRVATPLKPTPTSLQPSIAPLALNPKNPAGPLLQLNSNSNSNSKPPRKSAVVVGAESKFDPALVEECIAQLASCAKEAAAPSDNSEIGDDSALKTAATRVLREAKADTDDAAAATALAASRSLDALVGLLGPCPPLGVLVDAPQRALPFLISDVTALLERELDETMRLFSLDGQAVATVEPPPGLRSC